MSETTRQLSDAYDKMLSGLYKEKEELETAAKAIDWQALSVIERKVSSPVNLLPIPLILLAAWLMIPDSRWMAALTLIDQIVNCIMFYRMMYKIKKACREANETHNTHTTIDPVLTDSKPYWIFFGSVYIIGVIHLILCILEGILGSIIGTHIGIEFLVCYILNVAALKVMMYRINTLPYPYLEQTEQNAQRLTELENMGITGTSQGAALSAEELLKTLETGPLTKVSGCDTKFPIDGDLSYDAKACGFVADIDIRTGTDKEKFLTSIYGKDGPTASETITSTIPIESDTMLARYRLLPDSIKTSCCKCKLFDWDTTYVLLQDKEQAEAVRETFETLCKTIDFIALRTIMENAVKTGIPVRDNSFFKDERTRQRKALFARNESADSVLREKLIAADAVRKTTDFLSCFTQDAGETTLLVEQT